MSALVPIVALSSFRLTVPVGEPPNCDATDAVKITCWPTTIGFAVEDRVVVAPWLAFCGNATEVLACKMYSATP